MARQRTHSAPDQSRSERFRSTRFTDFDAVTGREIEWRYSPVARLQALTAGPLAGSRYDYECQSDDGVSVRWVGRDDSRFGTAGTPEDRSSANAWSSTDRILSIDITGDAHTTTVLRRGSMGRAPRAAHTIVTVAPTAHATLIIDNRGPAQLAENVEILIGDQASLTLVSVQDWDSDALHLATHWAQVGVGASLRHIALTLGGSIVRVNPTFHLGGAHGSVDALGVYFAGPEQHLEHQVYVHHDAADTTGRVSYKGAIQGVNSHAVWVGDVVIGAAAIGTDSYEQNRNLVLSEGTRVDSVPNLEIETGDIVGAGHASATGRFDEEQLFYLQSRGITAAEARLLVVRGFLSEVIHKVGDAALEERLLATIEAKLAE
jgi:Fe-S cluster assembly protein SufD